LLLVSAMLIAWTQSQGSAQAQSTGPQAASPAIYVRVIDGATIEDLRSATIYRIADVQAAPRDAACAAEARLGDRAAALAGALVARARTLELRATGDADRSGRPMAYLTADGRDIGEALIAQGFGRPARDNARPWCDNEGGLIL